MLILLREIFTVLSLQSLLDDLAPSLYLPQSTAHLLMTPKRPPPVHSSFLSCTCVYLWHIGHLLVNILWLPETNIYKIILIFFLAPGNGIISSVAPARYIKDIHLSFISNIQLITLCPFKPYIFLKCIHFYQHGQHAHSGHHHFSPGLSPQSPLPFKQFSTLQTNWCHVSSPLLKSLNKLHQTVYNLAFPYPTGFISRRSFILLCTFGFCSIYNEQVPIPKSTIFLSSFQNLISALPSFWNTPTPTIYPSKSYSSFRCHVTWHFLWESSPTQLN